MSIDDFANSSIFYDILVLIVRFITVAMSAKIRYVCDFSLHFAEIYVQIKKILYCACGKKINKNPRLIRGKGGGKLSEV